ncbi:MAG TPA: ABC-F family ATP-binding cassette domain-containing protein [Flavobacteriales bacterium]|nr:ABC-F family ATP-binding cassette domain-containing protein [Flavobacteriales bacterium]HPQ57198.1 ABC-F family ATP-binding cassette domain-containing protein [Flavobacteriales bacterium]
MNVLSVDRLAKAFGPRTLFEDVSFGAAAGQKIAIVGRNGSGKSTLLKCIAGVEQPDAGTITFNRGIRVGYLDQDVAMTSDRTLVDEMLDQDDDRSVAIRAYEHALAGGTGPALEKALARMEELKAWDHEARIKGLLSQFGLTDLEVPVNRLSGGQQKRLALAKVLLDRPDVLILDEPTNHLDVAMIEQLEGELAVPGLTLLLVTHDRYFLDNVCDELIEIERGGAQRFRGSYSYYVEKKALADAVAEATQQRLQGLMRRELAWMRRMPRARGTKSRSRVAAFHDLEEAAGKRAQKDELSLSVNVTRLGGKVIEVRNLHKAFGDRVIVDRFSYSFKRGDRIGLVGPNGVGKSTFIELITGAMPPDKGKVTIGDTVVLGHYDQQGAQWPEEKRVIEVVREIAEVIPLNKGRELTAAQLLERFLFDRDKQWDPVGVLSGGERRRLYLCTVLMANPNVLVLDEPTNDLDIPSLSALEDFLLDLDACILVVSHDRHFMDRVCDRLLVFEGKGAVRESVGSYSDYREALQAEQRKPAPATRQAPVGPTASKPRPRKITYAERLELERLELELPDLEAQRDSLTASLGEADLGHEELARRSLELQDLLRRIDTMSDRWLELSEKAEASA